MMHNLKVLYPSYFCVQVAKEPDCQIREITMLKDMILKSMNIMQSIGG